MIEHEYQWYLLLLHGLSPLSKVDVAHKLPACFWLPSGKNQGQDVSYKCWQRGEYSRVREDQNTSPRSIGTNRQC